MKISINKVNLKKSSDKPKAVDNIVKGQKLPTTWRPRMTISGVSYDEEKGAAGDEDVQNPLLYGFLAYMKASSFLSLCQMMGASNSDKITNGFKHYLKNKGTIAIPKLTYDIQEQRIVGHDGRHRAMSIIDVFGDVIIPVRMVLAKNLSGRIVNKDLIEDLNEYCTSENGSSVSGFLVAYISQQDGFNVV